jgi:hypothetical protein
MIDPALEHVLRGGLAVLLASGAVQKLRDLPRFRAAVAGYALLPERASGAAAAGFVLAEAALALGCLLPETLAVRGFALAAAALLFAVYGAAIGVNLARGRRALDCGCGGPAARVPISGWLVARNALLAAAALACASGAAPRALAAADVVTIAGGVAALALLWTAAHGLLAHAAAPGGRTSDAPALRSAPEVA